MMDAFTEAAERYWSYSSLATSSNREDRLAAKEHIWVLDLVTDIGEPDQGPPMDVLDALIRTAPDEQSLGIVGAGPLETLLVGYGAKYVDELEVRCRRDPRWRSALADVWWDGIEDAVAARLRKLLT